MQTPNHQYITQTGGTSASAGRHSEIIHAADASYFLVDGQWHRSPLDMKAMREQAQENRRNTRKSRCAQVRDETVDGEAAGVFSAHYESEYAKVDAVIWISSSSGLTLRQELDVDADELSKTHSSVRTKYSGVQAPAGVNQGGGAHGARGTSAGRLTPARRLSPGWVGRGVFPGVFRFIPSPPALADPTMTFVRLASMAIFTALFLDGCSQGGGAAAAAAAGDERTSFSAVINGKPVKADRVAGFSTNSATITPAGSEIHEIIFLLAPTSSDENAKPEVSLRFNFPVKQGSYDLTGTDIASCNNCGVMLAQTVNPFAQYTPQKMRVSITSLTATRVAGTFSGTMEFSFGTPDRVRAVAPKIMRVENGQFDIPIEQ